MLPTAARYWQEFGNTTGLYNFSFLFKSKGKIEKMFWALASVVGICLTIEDVKNTIGTFISSPTATRTTVFDNKTMELTHMTACVDFDVSQIKPENLAIQNSTEVSKFLQENEDLDLYEAFSGDSFHGNKQNETHTMFCLVLGMLTSIVRAEQMISSDRSNSQWGFPIPLNTSGQRRLLDFSTQSSIIVANNWLQTRYNYTKLLPYVGQFLCKMMDMTVKVKSYIDDKWESKVIFPCESESVTWLGIPAQSFADNEVICINLRSEFFRFQSPAENTLVSFRPTAVYKKGDKTNYKEATYVYLNLHEPFLSQTEHNLKFIAFESVLSVYIQLLGEYHSIDTPDDPCNQISTQLCLMRCRSKYIEENCKCRPLSYHSPSSWDLPVCGSNQHNVEMEFVLPQTDECMAIRVKYQPNTSCANECKPKCNQLLYGVTMVKDKSLRSDMGSDVEDKSITVCEVNIEVFKYPLIEEFPLLTAKDFFANLGGNLGLYLGASFIVILHIFVFFVNIISTETRQLLAKRMSKTKSNKQDESQVT